MRRGRSLDRAVAGTQASLPVADPVALITRAKGSRVQGILQQLTDVGQLAVIFAELSFVAVVWVAMLWRPRHKTHRRGHDCRANGCGWLQERPK